MYVIVFYGTGTNGQTLIVYGPYATLAAAQAAVGAQASPQSYTILQVFNPPGPGVTPPLTPQNVAVGNIVVALGVANLIGSQQFYLYGVFTSQAAAQAWIAGRPYPGGTLVCTVQVAL